MIATRNRVEELVKTLEACQRQDWREKEIIVVDDASTDGTYDLVRRDFPDVQILRNEVNQGSIAARNTILKRATGSYIIALDDDSRFIENDACRRVVERMEAEPDLGIISFQAIGPEFPERMTAEGRLRGEWHCNSFAACGAAIRRSMLRDTDLLYESYFHTYDEPDLCLRAWNSGYRVLQWNEIVVYHEFSALNRNEQRNHRLHARNELCSVLLRYPWHLVAPALLVRLLNQFRYAVKRGWGLREPGVWLDVALKSPQALLNRRAVSSRALKIWLSLNRSHIVEAETVWKLGEQSWWSILRRTRSQPAQTTRKMIGASC